MANQVAENNLNDTEEKKADVPGDGASNNSDDEDSDNKTKKLWAIRNVNLEAIKLAKREARASGMRLGDWLESKILHDEVNSITDKIIEHKIKNRNSMSVATTDLTARLDKFESNLSKLIHGQHALMLLYGQNTKASIDQDCSV